jgi:integrase
MLERIIGRAAYRADLNKRVTAKTLRNTAATWLRQAGGSPRLVAEYLGETGSATGQHAVGECEELRAVVQSLADHAIDNRALAIAGNRTT